MRKLLLIFSLDNDEKRNIHCAELIASTLTKDMNHLIGNVSVNGMGLQLICHHVPKVKLNLGKLKLESVTRKATRSLYISLNAAPVDALWRVDEKSLGCVTRDAAAPLTSGQLSWTRC